MIDTVTQTLMPSAVLTIALINTFRRVRLNNSDVNSAAYWIVSVMVASTVMIAGKL